MAKMAMLRSCASPPAPQSSKPLSLEGEVRPQGRVRVPPQPQPSPGRAKRIKHACETARKHGPAFGIFRNHAQGRIIGDCPVRPCAEDCATRIAYGVPGFWSELRMVSPDLSNPQSAIRLGAARMFGICFLRFGPCLKFGAWDLELVSLLRSGAGHCCQSTPAAGIVIIIIAMPPPSRGAG